MLETSFKFPKKSILKQMKFLAKFFAIIFFRYFDFFDFVVGPEEIVDEVDEIQFFVGIEGEVFEFGESVSPGLMTENIGIGLGLLYQWLDFLNEIETFYCLKIWWELLDWLGIAWNWWTSIQHAWCFQSFEIGILYL